VFDLDTPGVELDKLLGLMPELGDMPVVGSEWSWTDPAVRVF
jgi:hypothetical protein